MSPKSRHGTREGRLPGSPPRVLVGPMYGMLTGLQAHTILLSMVTSRECGMLGFETHVWSVDCVCLGRCIALWAESEGGGLSKSGIPYKY